MAKAPVQPLSTVIGNVGIKGPSSRGSLKKTLWVNRVKDGAKVYVEDNLCLDKTSDPWSCVEIDYETAGNFVKTNNPPIWIQPLTILPSKEVENYVLLNSGARPKDDRDSVDKRIINEVKTKSGKIIDSQYEVGGWPSLEENYRKLTVPLETSKIEEWLYNYTCEVEYCPLTDEEQIEINQTQINSTKNDTTYEVIPEEVDNTENYGGLLKKDTKTTKILMFSSLSILVLFFIVMLRKITKNYY